MVSQRSRPSWNPPTMGGRGGVAGVGGMSLPCKKRSGMLVVSLRGVNY